ncbi:DUF5301 domain-containing protein [Clostridium sp. MB40-C1]|uniref:DUF5301 domain-containing protein n=1 Tax=Clostridium sp. MB40-C1 TaxID=3070996 RepID=UPI0027DEDA16|nr:DUF5301 domain-containing protein [Clostridium sp. MB40-C1]WMJ81640.1 DUF5301 domain-containing protein [Clostridium sp. MB40-C1]
MNRKTKWLVVITICIVVSVGVTFMLRESQLQVPKSEQLSSVVFINIIHSQGIEKITISEQSDIDNLLNILKNSNKTNKDSVSNFPNKTKFTIIRFNFLEGGSSWRSIYEENDNIYVDQPYVGVFRLNSNDLNLLNEIMGSGNKESISIGVDDILKNNF